MLKRLRGSIDGLVIKHTAHGHVLSRRPDMSRVKWSPAQQARRRLMQDAAKHYRKIMTDPKQAARLVAIAAKKKIPVSSLVMGEYLRTAGKSSAPSRIKP